MQFLTSEQARILCMQDAPTYTGKSERAQQNATCRWQLMATERVGSGMFIGKEGPLALYDPPSLSLLTVTSKLVTISLSWVHAKVDTMAGHGRLCGAGHRAQERA